MRRRYYVVVGLYCAFLFWMSHQSRLPKTDFDFDGSDKVAHFLAYGLLATLLSVGLHRAPKPARPGFLIFMPIAFPMLFGVSDEIHQAFIPGRTFSFLDMLADAAGALCAQLGCLYLFRKRPGPPPLEKQGT